MTEIVVLEAVKGEKEWCMALHGNHDEHQCHKEPGHEKKPYPYTGGVVNPEVHECYCGVWW